MFSAQASQPTTVTSSPSAATACTAPTTAAAPPMSDFIHSMDFGGLSERPPESKVMPLPTRWTVVFALRVVCSRRTSRGGRDEPSPTPRMPPYPPASSAASSSTSTFTPCGSTAARAASASAAGGRWPGGRFTRSRAVRTPAARAVARPTAALASLERVEPTTSCTDRTGALRPFPEPAAERCSSKE